MILNQERNEGALRKLIAQYDPENDLGSPAVTHADMALIIIIRDLIEVIGDLQNRVEELEITITHMGDNYD